MGRRPESPWGKTRMRSRCRPPPLPDETRFWQRITKTDSCWTYGNNPKRYPEFILNDGTYIKAHRYSWILNGGDLTDHDIVLHACDVRNCVNPEHLSLGTLKSNTQDMMNKGRNRGGYAQQAAKITKEDAKHIFKALDTGVNAKTIAKKYGLTAKTVSTMRVTRKIPYTKTKFIK